MKNISHYLLYTLLIFTIHLHAGDGNEVELRNQQLREAICDGDIGTVRDLLGRGADVNACSGFQESPPLHLAAYWGRIEIVRELVGRGVDVDALDYSGETSLHIAARSGYFEIAKFLLASGADTEKKSEEGQIAVDIAGEWGHDEVFEYIRDYNDIPVTKWVMEDI